MHKIDDRHRIGAQTQRAPRREANGVPAASKEKVKKPQLHNYVDSAILLKSVMKL